MSDNVYKSRDIWCAAFKSALPVMCGYVPLAMAFGLLMNYAALRRAGLGRDVADRIRRVEPVYRRRVCWPAARVCWKSRWRCSS